MYEAFGPEGNPDTGDTGERRCAAAAKESTKPKKGELRGRAAAPIDRVRLPP
jgi:hypothetical protein